MKKYSFFLTTDGEPDDFLAFFILTLFGTIHTIVVGESERPGDIADSCLRALDKIGIQTPPICIVGKPSKKHFAYRGQEHPENHIQHAYPQYTPEQYIEAFKKFVADAEESGSIPVFVGLKPLHETYENFRLLEKEMSKVTAICYGSFNYRSVHREHAIIPAQFALMLTRFKQCFTYESFLATGSNNSVNNVNEPELFSVTRVYSDSAFWTSFRILMKNWNRHMIEDDCYPTCRDLLADPDTVDLQIVTLAHIDSESQRIATIAPFLKDPNQAERFVKHNLKPLLAIRGYDGNQFLLADECAVLAFFEFEKYSQRSVISFKDGYTVAEATDDPAVNTFCYKDIPRDAMVRSLIEALGRRNQ